MSDVVIVKNALADDEDVIKKFVDYLSDKPKIEVVQVVVPTIDDQKYDDEQDKEIASGIDGFDKLSDVEKVARLNWEKMLNGLNTAIVGELDAEGPFSQKIYDNYEDKKFEDEVEAYVERWGAPTKGHFEFFIKTRTKTQGYFVPPGRERESSLEIRKELNKPVDMENPDPKGVFDYEGKPLHITEKYPSKSKPLTDSGPLQNLAQLAMVKGGARKLTSSFFKTMDIPKLQIKYDPDDPNEQWLEYDGELYDINGVMKELFGFDGGWEQYKKINREDLTRKRRTLKDGTQVGPSVRVIHVAFAFKEFRDNFNPEDYKAVAYISPGIRDESLPEVRAYSCTIPSDDDIKKTRRYKNLFNQAASQIAGKLAKDPKEYEKAALEKWKEQMSKECTKNSFEDVPSDVYKIAGQRTAMFSSTASRLGGIMAMAMGTARETRREQTSVQKDGKDISASKGFKYTYNQAFDYSFKVHEIGEKLRNLDIVDAKGQLIYLKMSKVAVDIKTPEGGTRKGLPGTGEYRTLDKPEVEINLEDLLPFDGEDAVTYKQSGNLKGYKVDKTIVRAEDGGKKATGYNISTARAGMPLSNNFMYDRFVVYYIPKNGKVFTDNEQRLLNRLGVRSDVGLWRLHGHGTKYPETGAWIDLNKIPDPKASVHPRPGVTRTPAEEEEHQEQGRKDAATEKVIQSQEKKIKEIFSGYVGAFGLDGAQGQGYRFLKKNEEGDSKAQKIKSILPELIKMAGRGRDRDARLATGSSNYEKVLKNIPKGDTIIGKIPDAKQWGSEYLEDLEVLPNNILITQPMAMDSGGVGSYVISWRLLEAQLMGLSAQFKTDEKIDKMIRDALDKGSDPQVGAWLSEVQGQLVDPIDKAREYISVNIISKLEFPKSTLGRPNLGNPELEDVDLEEALHESTKEHSEKIYSFIDKLIDECISEHKVR